ncbi:MAG: ribulose-phosphate 3-epimerase [Mucinivorans sp.]
MKRIISPSLLSADFLNLGTQCAMLNQSQAQWFHLDIMDGSFVPNISYGLPVVEAVRRATTKQLDVHLMIDHPENYIAQFKAVGADVITIHAEATHHLHRLLQSIHDQGALAGVALNPATPLCLLEEVLSLSDMVLLMSVNPGFGGQKFIETTYSKIERLRGGMGYRGIIQVDGGVNTHNAAQLFAAGADCLVAGSAVFGSVDPQKTIEEILNA